MSSRAAILTLALLLVTPAARASTCEGAVARSRAGTLRGAAHAVERHFRLPTGLLVAVVDQENEPWEPAAPGRNGEVGLGQIKPGTMLYFLGMPANTANLGWAAHVLRHPIWNLCWAGRILAGNLTVCAGNRACAIGCYNAGAANCRYTARVLARIEPASTEGVTP